MSTTSLEAILADVVRAVIRQELTAVANASKAEFLTPGELAERLKVPESWVYEQSRMNKIPTHRMGRYIRFDLREVIESQKKNGASS